MAEKELDKKFKADRAADLRRLHDLAGRNKSTTKLEEGASLPPPIKDITNTPMEAVARNWAHQSRNGQISICDKEGCYYPLNPARDPARENDLIPVFQEMEIDGELEKVKVGHQGICSWGGEGHGEQLIRLPEPKED